MPASAPERLRAIAAALKEAGDRGNLNAMRRGIRAESSPLVAAAREAARTQLPKSGGLNEYEATQKITISVLTSARTTAVRIRGRASQSTDNGTWRHPNPRGGGWSSQSYPGADGWWTKTMERKAPEATVLIMGQLEAVAAKIRAL